MNDDVIHRNTGTGNIMQIRQSTFPGRVDYGIYNLLTAVPNTILAVYSPEPAERLLTAVDAALTSVSLTQARHRNGGALSLSPTDVTTFWSLIDSDHGSAIIFLFLNESAPLHQELLDKTDSDGDWHAGDGATMRLTHIEHATCDLDAATIIGTGDIVAPWGVPGYESTATPYNSGSESGHDTYCLPPQLYRAMLSTGWSNPTTPGLYVKRVSVPSLNLNDIQIYAGAGVFGESQLLMATKTGTESLPLDTQKAVFQDISRLGPYHTTIMPGMDSVMISTPIDANATGDQLDRQAQNLLAAVYRWILIQNGQDDPYPNGLPAESGNTELSNAEPDEIPAGPSNTEPNNTKTDDMTFVPDSDASPSRLSDELPRTGWDGTGNGPYRKSFVTPFFSNGKTVEITDANADHPEMAFEIGKATLPADRLESLSHDLAQFGPYHATAPDDDRILAVTPVDDTATGDQVDRQAHDLLAAVYRWACVRNGQADPYPNGTVPDEPAPVQPPTESMQTPVSDEPTVSSAPAEPFMTVPSEPTPIQTPVEPTFTPAWNEPGIAQPEPTTRTMPVYDMPTQAIPQSQAPYQPSTPQAIPPSAPESPLNAGGPAPSSTPAPQAGSKPRGIRGIVIAIIAVIAAVAIAAAAVLVWRNRTQTSSNAQQPQSGNSSQTTTDGNDSKDSDKSKDSTKSTPTNSCTDNLNLNYLDTNITSISQKDNQLVVKATVNPEHSGSCLLDDSSVSVVLTDAYYNTVASETFDFSSDPAPLISGSDTKIELAYDASDCTDDIDKIVNRYKANNTGYHLEYHFSDGGSDNGSDSGSDSSKDSDNSSSQSDEQPSSTLTEYGFPAIGLKAKVPDNFKMTNQGDASNAVFDGSGVKVTFSGWINDESLSAQDELDMLKQDASSDNVALAVTDSDNVYFSYQDGDTIIYQRLIVSSDKVLMTKLEYSTSNRSIGDKMCEVIPPTMERE